MYYNEKIDYLKYLKHKKIIIFGAGKEGKRVCYKCQQENFEVIGFCDNDICKKGKEIISGILCIGNVDDIKEKIESDIIVIIASSFVNEMMEELLDKQIPFIDSKDIDFSCSGDDYYDENYFEWQKRCGKFGANLDKKRFQRYIKTTDSILELGSAGGYLLEVLEAKEKIGIEINDIAREEAQSRGIKSVKTMQEVPNEYADVIISTHVLEHIENPLEILRALKDKLKENGKLIFIVPHECNNTAYSRNELNQHLYTWNELLLGNLFKRAGYFVKEVYSYDYQWPYTAFEEIHNHVGDESFEVISELFGAKVNIKNVLIVATK